MRAPTKKVFTNVISLESFRHQQRRRRKAGLSAEETLPLDKITQLSLQLDRLEAALQKVKAKYS